MPINWATLLENCNLTTQYLHITFYTFRQDNGSTQSARSAEEKSLRAILFTMSLLFIVCQAWKIVPDVYELFFCRENGHHCRMDGPVSKHVTLLYLLLKIKLGKECLTKYMLFWLINKKAFWGWRKPFLKSTSIWKYLQMEIVFIEEFLLSFLTHNTWFI